MAALTRWSSGSGNAAVSAVQHDVCHLVSDRQPDVQVRMTTDTAHDAGFATTSAKLK